MKCFAEDYCKRDRAHCSEVCGAYRVLRALFNLSRMPERYRYTIKLTPDGQRELIILVKRESSRTGKDKFSKKNIIKEA